MGDVVLLGVMWKARLIGAGLFTFQTFLEFFAEPMVAIRAGDRASTVPRIPPPLARSAAAHLRSGSAISREYRQTALR